MIRLALKTKQILALKFGFCSAVVRTDAARRPTVFDGPLSTFISYLQGEVHRLALAYDCLVTRLTRLLFFGLSLLSCSLERQPLAPEGAMKVLFIGSSLIDAHDLPRTLAQLAISGRLQPCYCVSVAYQDYELDDHYALGDALRALNSEHWDYVVLQQGPSALPESRVRLLKGAGDFAKVIEQRGAQTILYEPWPAMNRQFDFPAVIESYRIAADSVRALLAPAGEAWLLAWQRDGTLPLYGPNGYYPSEMGSYLAALVIFQRIYDHSPVGIQITAIVNGRSQDWVSDQVRLLQEAAAAANAAELARTHLPVGTAVHK